LISKNFSFIKYPPPQFQIKPILLQPSALNHAKISSWIPSWAYFNIKYPSPTDPISKI